MIRLGLPGLPLPVSAGGSGRGLVDLCLVAEELGATALSTPLLTSTALGAYPLLWSDDAPASANWIGRLASGESIATAAILDGAAQNEWSAPTVRGAAEGDGWRLTGTKTLVPYAAVADVVILTAQLDDAGPALFAVPGDALLLSHSKLRVVGGDPLYVTNLDGLLIGRDALLATGAEATALLGRALDVASVLSVAYATGLARGALGLAVEYAAERHQFGRPIGALQGVAFRCADRHSQ
jgi:3-oxocholest-4-en-26-oyl-CoA dehydrogenase beta subunit